MTPEDKAMTEKSMQMSDDGQNKIPLRSDTYELVGGEKKEEAKAEEAKKDDVKKEVEAKEDKVEDKKNEAKPVEADTDPIVEQLTNEAMVKMIDEKLKKMGQSDFLKISVNKTGAYVWMGVLLVILWLLPAVNLGLNKLTQGKFSLDSLRSDHIVQLYTPASTPEPTPEPVNKIRVRLGSDSLTEAQEIEQKLIDLGFTQAEFWYDDQINSGSVMIVTKNEDENLKNQLTSMLAEKYVMSSESAVLTDDSDFIATILIGKDAVKTE